MNEKDIVDMIKQALKNGEKSRVSAFRMLLSEVKNKRIEDKVTELEPDKVLSVIQKIVKRHKESIEQFKQADRADLVKTEEEGLAMLQEYLPEQLSEEEIKRIITESISRTGASSPADMGKVMKDVMGHITGQADGKVINRIVLEILNK